MFLKTLSIYITNIQTNTERPNYALMLLSINVNQNMFNVAKIA